MKKLLGIVALAMVFGFSTAYADPRMETVGDFCHSIHDNENDDNETFLADCGSQISVLQGDVQGQATAQGFAKVVIEGVPVDFDEVTMKLSGLISDVAKDAASIAGKKRPLMRSIVITNETFPDLDCTMVDSNATEYTSQNWVSRITFKRQHRWSDIGTLIYQLRCIDGKEVAE